MDQFVDVFIQEAKELIDKLEESLLVLESSPADADSLDSVFRVMHTLKGNAKMFGYEQMGILTHQLESIYDNIRSGRANADAQILSITLQTVDHLRKIINDPNLQQAENQANQSKLLASINTILVLQESNNRKTESSQPPEKEVVEKVGVSTSTYYITFHPKPDMLCNGTNPLYILEDLAELGQVRINAHKKDIPGFEGIDPTMCYTFWEIYLVTECEMDEINDVFLFVEDVAQIGVHKVADEDLLKFEEFVERIEENKQQQVLINIDELQQYVNHLLQIIREKSVDENNRKESGEQKISSIRVSSEKIDHLINLVSELVTIQARLSNISHESDIPGLSTVAESMEKLSRQLRDDVFNISLIPINHLFMRFQRMVRDLSKELGKEVDLLLEGGDTELDKNLIETLSDPIMHILRNCLDHGIESAKERKKSGKPEKGIIEIKAYYSGANVVIKISDDGAGLDFGKIKAKAVAKGLIANNSTQDDKELTNLLFMPGFTTATEVTNVSGRGVGMDIVKRKIDEIRGEVKIESNTGRGTTIKIILPLTLSIIDGLMVIIDQTSYIIQMGVVDKILVASTADVRDCYNDLLTIEGEQIQIIDLRKEFDYEAYGKAYQQIVVVDYDGNRIGVVVDKVVGQIQTVVKPLGKMYQDQEYISGATILGDGSVALILDTNKLIYQSIY